MSNSRYTIGVDFGSLSGRGVLVDTANGAIRAEAVQEYPHGILTSLPDGTPLAGEWMLQHPGDYELVLETVIPALLEQSGVPGEQIIGIGVDFTASTVVPVDADFRPLSENPKYAGRPHAWTKLWKHHGAKPQAELLTTVTKAQNRPYLGWYGGSISQECLMSKVVQVFQEDREVFDAADCFMEAGDYVSSLLAGEPVFSLSMASAKAFWNKETGYPDDGFFAAVDPELAGLPKNKLMAHFPRAHSGYPGTKVGELCPEMAQKLGLKAGIAISAAQMDAYAAMPGLGICEPGTMMLMVGTSTAALLLSEKNAHVEGVTACLPHTFYPGLWGYGSGQASVGDGFQWFADNCVPESYAAAAREKGVSLQTYLTDLAAELEPGQTGLIALDWFNGNKSCLANSRLSAMVLGLNLGTRPEHIFRALLEATAFGCRAILEAYEKVGVPVREITVCGGIAVKNPFMMQMYADVLGKPLRVSRCTQAAALGASIYAAAAAGEGTVFETARRMGAGEFLLYAPNQARRARYDALYREYMTLHDYFGRGENSVMERLHALRNG